MQRRLKSVVATLSVLVGMVLAFVVVRQGACLEDADTPDDVGAELGEVDVGATAELDDDGVVAIVPASDNELGVEHWQVHAGVPSDPGDAVRARIDGRGADSAVTVLVDLPAGEHRGAKLEIRAGNASLDDTGRDAVLAQIRGDLQSGTDPATGACDLESGNLAHNLVEVIDRCSGDGDDCGLARTFYRDAALALACCSDPAWPLDPARGCPVPIGPPGGGQAIAFTGSGSGGGGTPPSTCTPGRPCCGRPEGWVEPNNLVIYAGYGHSHPMSGDFRDGCLGPSWTPPPTDNFCCTSANADGTCNGGNVGATGELSWGPILRNPTSDWWHDPAVQCSLPGAEKDCCPLLGDNCDRRTSNYPAGVQCKLTWSNKTTVGGKITTEISGKLTTDVAFKVLGCGIAGSLDVGAKVSLEGNISGEWATTKEFSPTKYLSGCDCISAEGCISKITSKTDWFLPAGGVIIGKIGGVEVTRTHCGFDTKAGGNAIVNDERWMPDSMIATTGPHGGECRPPGSTESGYCGVSGGECGPPPGDAGVPPPPPDAASYPHSGGDAMPLPHDDPFDPGDNPNFP